MPGHLHAHRSYVPAQCPRSLAPVPHRPRRRRAMVASRRPPRRRRPGWHVWPPGGSAADAAIATNAVLAVTAPAPVRHGRRPVRPRPRRLGRAGGARTRRAGPARVPTPTASGPRATPPCRSATTPRASPCPGCVDGWLALHARFGRLPLAERAGAGDRLRRRRLPGLAPARRASARRTPSTVPAGAAGLAAQATPVRRPRAPARVRRGRCGRSPPTGRAGFYGGEFGAGLLGLGAGEYTDGRPRTAAGRLGRPARADAWGHGVWTVPPQLAGLPDPRRRRGSPTGWPSPATLTTRPWAHLLVEAAIAAGHDRPDVLCERRRRPRAPGPGAPPGPAPAPPSTSNRVGAARSRRPAPATPPTCASSTATGWACRSSSRTPRASAATSSSRRPASTSTTAASASRWCPATRPSTAPGRAPAAHAVPRRSSTRAGRLAAGRARHPGRRRPAPDPAAGAGPAAQPGQSPAEAIGSPAGC